MLPTESYICLLALSSLFHTQAGCLLILHGTNGPVLISQTIVVEGEVEIAAGERLTWRFAGP